ncbi:MAG: hypothetical protein EBR82_14920 [Caulobacteraceae bacterium]|nr:hypothetical protein [Caulobacteraceae bacterium]
MMLTFPECLRELTVEDVLETVCSLSESTVEELYGFPLDTPMPRAWRRLSAESCEDLATAAQSEEERCAELAEAIGL